MAMTARSAPKISHWISQLGLRDLYPPQRRTRGHDACPQMGELREGITQIVEDYYMMSNVEIKSSMEIRDASRALLDKNGAFIWSDANNRPWLFTPGQGAAEAPYPRHLRYSNPHDKAYLEEHLYGYILARVLCGHKRNFRNSLQGDDDSIYHDSLAGDSGSRLSKTPSVALKMHFPSSAKSRLSTGREHSRCVAGLGNDHLDATRLDQLGVWLGSYDDESVSVNGLSQLEVERNYFDSTLGGTNLTNAEPHALPKLPNNASSCEESVVCVACRDELNTPSLHLQTMIWSPDDDPDVEEQAPMHMHAWIFRCKFRGQDVYAFVKELLEKDCKKLGFPGMKLWSFWHLDGGYTTKVLLAKPRQDPSFPVLKSDLPNRSMKRKRSTTDVEGGMAGPSTLGRQANDKDRVQGGDLRDSQQTRPHGSSFQPINAINNAGSPESTTLPGRRSSSGDLYDATPPAERNKRRSHNAALSAAVAEQPTPVQPRPDLAVNLSSNSFESRSRSRSAGEGHLCPAATASPEASAHPAQGKVSMPPPPRALIFKIWFPFQISGTAEEALKVVRFNTAMTFEQAITHARTKLERQLKGQHLIGMTVRSKVDGKSSFFVDEDDSWEEVVDMVKNTGGEELDGKAETE